MSFCTLPLSYCTNVHPATSAQEVIQGLNNYTANVSKELNHPISAGLWLARSVIDDFLHDKAYLSQLVDCLAQNQLSTYTLNTFPFGDFHQERVKDNVYLPHWASEERLQYTKDCAKVLSQILEEGVEGSLSTVPLGYKHHTKLRPENFEELAISQLLSLATFLDDMHDETGKVIRLAIEPEPHCLLETTLETVSFFQKLYQQAEENGRLEVAQRHLGVCYDVCHQSVEFEDVEDSIDQLNAAGIRINKIHITCAVELSGSTLREAQIEAIKHFVEPRYLHQSFLKTGRGELLSCRDLNTAQIGNWEELLRDPQNTLRVHFHVPVNEETIGPLSTTRMDLLKTLRKVYALEYAPHLEIETYTWGVLPGENKPDLVQGITQEFLSTQELLQQATIPKVVELPSFELNVLSSEDSGSDI